MKILKRAIISVILLDNFLTHLPKKFIFKTRYILADKCSKCGNCCKEIHLKATRRQLSSRLFTALAIKWIEWIFDFILLKIDYEYNYLSFTCKHIQPDGKCGNYFWRPGICRNYPLLDYFKQPVFLPECGYSTELR